MHPLTLVDDEAERAINEAEQADRLDRRNATIVAVLGLIGVILSGALLILGQSGL